MSIGSSQYHDNYDRSHTYRAGISQITHGLERRLTARRMKTRLVFIFVELPHLLAKLCKQMLLVPNKLYSAQRKEGQEATPWRLFKAVRVAQQARLDGLGQGRFTTTWAHDGDLGRRRIEGSVRLPLILRTCFFASCNLSRHHASDVRY